jgi:thiopurine S-methyltransferase
MELDKNFWEEKFRSNNTGFDIGDISTPLKNYFDQITDKDVKILIPGSGNGHEAEYLQVNGFNNVFVLDWAEEAIKNFTSRFPDFPTANIFNENFFEHEGSYDIIVEQTFFCALNPSLRKNYVTKVHSLLKENGKLVGLLFNRDFGNPFPPYGGSKDEYINLFEPYFNFKYFDDCYNSIPPRAGTELFINLLKK